MAETRTPGIIGIPYEEGMYWRKGAREGPEAIRRQLAKMGNYSLRLGRRSAWDLAQIDRGDIETDRYSSSRTRQIIEREILGLLSQKIVPVVIGGDHSITLPVVRALAKHWGQASFGILHFDAHSDTFEPVDGYEYHHGAVFRNIVEEELVEPTAIFQLGLRGQVHGEGLEFAHNAGIRCVSRDDFAAASGQLEQFGVSKERRYFVSIDIDVVDPAFAPGTGTPVPGGLTSSEILRVVSQLADFDLVGMDLVEVSPIYDPSDITSLLAAHIVFEMIAGARWC